MLSLLKIQDYLNKANRGDVTISPSLLEEFARDCKDSANKQLSGREKTGWRIRMSGLGRPLCQQMLERDGKVQDMEYNALFRFLFGDITEAIVMMVLKGAGIKIVDAQKSVELKIDNNVIKGTLDVILEDELGQQKVWDIKSASDWAFKNKYRGGYETLTQEDPFGYVMQGHLYGEATGLPFGGWIVVNKSSGELLFVEVPDWKQDDKETYLKDAKARIKILTNPKAKFVKFPLDWETYRRGGEVVRTGNKVLSKECSFCGYRKHCWPKAILHDKITSKAKNPPQVWYEKLKTKEM
jgi:hypothetical protein|tara:strand:+ start:7185 stop:8072 length:888 start_codon:yes stop_codon:yes gene_type:complete